MSITRELARFVAGTDHADLPSAACDEATRTALNFFGCALGGCRHESIDLALAAFSPFSGPAQAGLIGRGERLDILNAALLNGASAHVLDFDDAHLPTLLHPGAAVLPAALALAEYRPDGRVISGAALLAATLLGTEVACRIAAAIWREHNAQWYVTGTAGAVGAAATAAKLLRLDQDGIVHAMGIAVSQAAGTRGMMGTMCKALIHGAAARNGLAAALLAQRGFTSAEASIEGKNGLIDVFATAPRTDVVLAELGTRWEARRNSYKPYACGVVLHAAIDALVSLRERHAIDPRAVSAVHLAVSPRTLQLAGVRKPGSGLESKWSLFHSAAVALIDGAAAEAQYADARVRDPEVRRLRALVQAQPDAALDETQARAEVVLGDGRRFEHCVEHVLGSVERPMSDAQLDAKVHALGDEALDLAAVDSLIARVRDMARCDDAAELVAAARPGTR